MTVGRIVAAGSLLIGLLAGPLPALADPVPDGGRDAKKVDRWDPDRPVPELTEPGTGKKVKPFQSLNPMGPTALPGLENAKVSTLDPGGAAVKRVDGAERTDGAQARAAEEYWCESRMGRENTVYEEPGYPGEPPAQFAQVIYVGEVVCNVWLDYMAGLAGLVDRTPGYDGRTLHTGTPFQYTDWHMGSSAGAVEIPGDATDGARQAEVVFEAYLVAPAPMKWGNCGPGPGQRVLYCSGVGTSTLHVITGLGVFDTRLRPPTAKYVALGDSFASGTGIGRYDVPGPAACLRSYLSYPYMIGGMKLPNGTVINPTSRACHGAVIDDIYIAAPEAYPESSQLSYVNPETTRMVTVSIGGNDLGFADRLIACNLVDSCGIAGGQLVTPAQLQAVQGRLMTLYRQILDRVRPDGIVVVLSYPMIFPMPGEGYTWCSRFGGIAPDEIIQIQQAGVAIRGMLMNAVRGVGSPRVRLVDMYDAYAGHHVCSADPWATGPQADVQGSFHPNASGHWIYRNKIVQALGLRA